MLKDERDILSWCAGLFDADGCLCLYLEHNKKARKYPYLKATATLDIREEVATDIFINEFGGSKRKKKSKCSRHSSTFVWRVSGSALDNFLRKMQGYLILKAPQADLVMRARAVRQGRTSNVVTEQEHQEIARLIDIMSKLNATGVGKSWQPAALYVQHRKLIPGENME